MFKSANQEIDKLQVNTLLDMGQLVASGPKVLLRVQKKTADYTVTNLDSGTIFHNTGDAGAITYTLPALPIAGLFYVFVCAADQDMTVNAAAVDQMLTFNDLDADGVAISTTSQQLGGAILVIGLGTLWWAQVIGANTLSVTT